MDTDQIEQAPVNDNDGILEMHLRRVPDFDGYGFHIQYNKVYYLVTGVEDNSPAFQSGLRANDVILKLNDRSTDEIRPNEFVELVNESSEIILHIQTYDGYIRDNPHLLQ